MPGDIRSYFNAIPKNKSQPTHNPSGNKRKISFDNDASIIPETPSPKTKTDNKKKRKMIISSDSDDSVDSFVPAKISKVKNGNAIEKQGINNSSKIKEVKPVEMFGSAPAQRTSVVKQKSNKEKVSCKTEVNIHSDEKFEKTLIQLDKEKSVENKLNNSAEKKSSKSPKMDKSKKSPVDKNINSYINDNLIKNEINQSFKSETITKTDKKTKTSPISKNISSVTNKTLPPEKVKNMHESKVKKDFSSFINDDPEMDDAKNIKVNYKKEPSVSPSTSKENDKSRKRKLSEKEKTPEITDEERFERKRQSKVLYQSYLNRSGPKHLGSKEVPKGSPDCLKGFTFLITGVLDSFERDEVADIIKQFSGELKSTLSKKVSHVICGEDGGPAKIAKAEKLGIKIIDEDEFLNLIKENSTKFDDVDSKKNISPPSSAPKPKISPTNTKNKSKSPVKNKIGEKQNSHNDINKCDETEDVVKIDKADESIEIKDEKKTFDKNIAWVDKYRPTTMKQIIGQHGEASCASKLYKWLSKWYQNRKAKLPKPNPWSKGDGGYYRAILLSGSPGVGKTTTVSVVSKELGFDSVEFNASDTRSKSLIQQQLTELTCTNSLSGFVKGKIGKGAVSKKHLIIMDEVDGMAGNEDRGGMQELLNVIKKTEVPIICICNDKSSPKMRSLLNYCYDVTFPKPKVEQIRAALMSICFKEGIEISPKSLTELIIGASQDMRQILNLLSMWSSTGKNLSADTVSNDAKMAKKDIKTGPWTTCRSIFSNDEHKTMSIHDKSDLFFNDYSMIPLFVHQNYLKVVPHHPKNDILGCFAKAADSISAGDLVDSKIRKGMAWNLLPTQAMFSSVIPGSVLSGHIQGHIDFPNWLGQNSRANKMNRLAQEIQSHTRLSASGSKESIHLDYAYHIRNAVLNPLTEGIEGVQKAVETLQSYNLLRDDLDTLIELSKWPGQKDINASIDSRIKAAMTKKYNKEVAPLPYSQVSMKKNKSAMSKDSGFDDFIDIENLEDVEEEKDNSDVENDAMIKKNKTTSKTKEKVDKKTTSRKPNKKEKGKKK